MTSQPTSSRYPDYIVVKFKDTVKLPYSDSFVQSEANLERAGLSPLNQLFHEFEGTIMQRLFSSVPPEEVASLEETATREPAFTGEMGVQPRHSNILSYFRIIPPPNVNAESIIERLRQLDFVEEAYIEGKPTPPPFVNQSDDPLAKFQTYEAPAPQGIDSHFAWALRGGDGESLMFVDLEQGWTLNHEDLVNKGITIISGVNNRFFAHGTNVLGEIAGVDNNVGIVGIGPNLDSVQVVSQWRTASNFSTADAILSATNQLVKEAKQRKKGGSVLLLEAQTTVTHTMPGVHLPVEVEPAVFDAIKLATNSGIIVVEAAGNGLNNGGPGADLDQFVNTTGKRVLNRNSPDFKDSGAIIVAAASSGVPHSRMSFSNFGSRIDCYAWGENVTTTGSSKAPGSPTAYTHSFSGTSSASPIIAGAALALQGISEAYLGTSFSPLNVRSMLSLVATGTASANPSVEKIGVMPNLKKIITVSMGLTPAVILAKDLAALVNELLGSGLIPRPLCHTFGKAMPVLKAGSKGPQVEFLQRALAHIKHSPGAFDGIFGEQTKAAVNRFQTSVQLSPDGITGPNTWSALCTSFSSTKKKVVVTLDARGGEVRVLQHFLSKQGFGPGSIDGIFGDSTRNAVIQFQQRSGLIPNGIVESGTWAKLLQSKLLLGSQQQERVVVSILKGGNVNLNGSTGRGTAQAVASRVAAPTVQKVPKLVRGSPNPGPNEALVGSSRDQMRRAAARIIHKAHKHLLKFLLDSNGEFKKHTGLRKHSDLANNPDLVEMSHVRSAKIGGTAVVIQDAWRNQINNGVIEMRHVGGAILGQEVISIGGIAVARDSAREWENLTWLPRGTVDAAPRVII
jgi:peptidoglycan hydrolase-like protein with peptidoglycan-binding domain